MTKEQYRRKFDIFRSTCLLYATEKSQLEQLEKRYPSLKEINIEEGKFRIDLSREYEAGELERYQLLKENVEMTETYFKDIEEMFGEKAKDILWELFIQDRSQTDVGEDCLKKNCRKQNKATGNRSFFCSGQEKVVFYKYGTSNCTYKWESR